MYFCLVHVIYFAAQFPEHSHAREDRLESHGKFEVQYERKNRIHSKLDRKVIFQKTPHHKSVCNPYRMSY